MCWMGPPDSPNTRAHQHTRADVCVCVRDREGGSRGNIWLLSPNPHFVLSEADVMSV